MSPRLSAFEALFRASRFSLVALPLLAACGLKAPGEEDDSPKGSSKPSPNDCRTFSPCGGNPLGRWVMRSSCVGAVPSDPACAGYASKQAVSGTAIYDFGADGVLRYEGSVHVQYEISATEACAQAVARKDTAGYCKLVESSADDNPFIPASITCTSTEALCSCEVDQGPISGGADSSYSISGNSLTILADGAATTLGYCVGIDTLTLGSLSGEPSTVFYRQ